MEITDGILIRAALLKESKRFAEERIVGSGYTGDELMKNISERYEELSKLLTDQILDRCLILSL